MKRVIAASLAVVMMFGLSACATDPLAEQFRTGDNKNYISGDGSVTEFNGTKSVGQKWT
jgi:hypothetical protein